MTHRATSSAGAVAFCIGLFCGSVSAQEPESEAITALLDRLSDQTIRAIGAGPDTYLERILGRMRDLNPSGEVAATDIEAVRLRGLAKERANALRSTLERDLDGDGRVTPDEFTLRSNGTVSERSENFLLRALVFDRDGDGVLSIPELYAHADHIASAQLAKRRRHADVFDFAQFDSNSDGTTTEAEVREGVGHVVLALNARRAQQPEKDDTVTCALPGVPPGAQIILVSGYEGAGVSTVSVDGQDRVTRVATLTIEQGDRPLYVIVASTSLTIWQVDGAVARVTRFIVQPNRASLGPGAAVIGLPAEIVSFTAPDVCFKAFKKIDGLARRAAAGVSRALQLEAGQITTIGHYTLQDVHLPSGNARKARSGSFLGITFTNPASDEEQSSPERSGRRVLKEADDDSPLLPNSRRVEPAMPEPTPIPEAMQAEIDALTGAMLRSEPAGLVEIDPNDVVSPGKVERYEVLPLQAGIIQLLKSGAMRMTSEQTYTVVKEIPRFPPGWRIHSLPFRRIVFGAGVPRPNSDTRGP